MEKSSAILGSEPLKSCAVGNHVILGCLVNTTDMIEDGGRMEQRRTNPCQRVLDCAESGWLKSLLSHSILLGVLQTLASQFLSGAGSENITMGADQEFLEECFPETENEMASVLYCTPY